MRDLQGKHTGLLVRSDGLACGESVTQRLNAACLNLTTKKRELVQSKMLFTEFVRDGLGARTLLITCGLPGTWKTEISEEVSRLRAIPILRSDLIRLEVLKGEDVFDAKVASDMGKRVSVYDEMFRRADDLMQTSRQGLILDATFVTQELRRRAAAVAVRHDVAFVILQTHCSEEASVARILKRTKENYESNALTREAYLDNKKRFETVDLDDLKRRYPRLEIVHLTVDTEHDRPEDWSVIAMEKRQREPESHDH